MLDTVLNGFTNPSVYLFIPYGLIAIAYGLWPQYGYKRFPEGRYRLKSSDWMTGPFGIFMKVWVFRLSVCSYGAFMILGGITCYSTFAAHQG